VLDAILAGTSTATLGRDELVAAGHDAGVVDRRAADGGRGGVQAAPVGPGTKISIKAFGRDRRLPITNRFREGRG
jgi:NAD+ synthase (glutamine-hydrolysing)